jgi:hypothetical protein
MCHQLSIKDSWHIFIIQLTADELRAWMTAHAGDITRDY